MNKITGMQKIRQFAKQKGAFLLLEMSVVSIIASMAVATALIQQKNALQTERYEAQGELLKTLSASLDSYIASNYIELTKNANATANAAGTAVAANMYGPTGSTTTNIPNIYAPTVANLITLGFLPTGFSSTSLLYDGSDATGVNKAQYLIKIGPAAGTPASSCPNCNLQGLAYLDKPVKANEIKNLGTAITTIGANGLYSITDATTTAAKLYGRNGSTERDNPVSGTPAGILAASNDYATSGLSNFMRIDGTSRPSADQNWNAKNLTNVGSLNAGTGTVNTATGVWTAGTSGVRVDSNGNIYASGTIYGTLANAASTTSLDLKPTSGSRTNANFLKSGAIVVSSDLNATPGAAGSIIASGDIKGGSITSTGSIYTGDGNTAIFNATPTGTGAYLGNNGTIYASQSITAGGQIKGGSISTTGTITGATTITANGLITGSGGLNAGGNGIGNAGAITGATTITASGVITGSGGLNAGGNGIGNAGAITGATTITASGLITGSGGLNAGGNGIGNAGAITGATTITASSDITGRSFTTSNSNAGINVNGAVIGQSLYIGDYTKVITNGTSTTSTIGTTTTGVGFTNTGTLNIKNSDAATATGTTIFNIASVSQSALLSVKNWADNIANAVLTILGTIKASGGNLVATLSGSSGGNVMADAALQLTQKSNQAASVNSPTGFTSFTAADKGNGGWFVSSDNYLTSLNGKNVWMGGKVYAGGGLTAAGAGIASNNAAISVYNAAGDTMLASMSAAGAITGTSLSTGTGNITGGAITGSSLSAGTGNITGGAITGTSVNAGSGTIQTTGTISGGTITATTLSGATATRNGACTTPGTLAKYSENITISGVTKSYAGVLTCELTPAGTNVWVNSYVTLDSNVHNQTALTGGTSGGVGRDCSVGEVMTGVTINASNTITQIRCSPIYQGYVKINKPT